MSDCLPQTNEILPSELTKRTSPRTFTYDAVLPRNSVVESPSVNLSIIEKYRTISFDGLLAYDISHDGATLLACLDNDQQEEDQDNHSVTLNRILLDESKGFWPLEQGTTSISREAAKFSVFRGPKHPISKAASFHDSICPPPISNYEANGSLLRIGTTSLFIPQDYSTSQRDLKSFDDLFYEEALVTSSHVVISHRRCPKENCTVSEAAEQSRIKELSDKLTSKSEARENARRRRIIRRRRFARGFDSSSSSEDRPGAGHFSDDASVASFDKASSEASEVEDDEEPVATSSDSEADEKSSVNSYLEDDNTGPGEIEFASEDSSSSSSSDDDSLASLDTDSDNGSVFDELPIFEIQSAAEDAVADPTQTRARKEEYQYKYITCDVCGEFCPDDWFHCVVCANNDFDLCMACVGKGNWCMSKEHRLQHCDHDGVASITSFDNFETKQLIRVYPAPEDLKPEDLKPIFTYEAKLENLLYDSPPAIHPRQHLAAWALSPERLLLFTFGEHSNHIKYKLKPVTKRGHKNRISLHFSGCGSYLYIASIESARVKNKVLSNEQTKALRPPAQARLSLHLSILRVKASDGTIKPPTQISARQADLGVLDRQSAEKLPCNWSWTAENMNMITASPDHGIRIFKAQLPSDSAPIKTLAPIMQREHALPLPESMSGYSVHYSPMEVSDCHTLVLGSIQDGIVAVTHPSNEDLGDWVEVAAQNP